MPAMGVKPLNFPEIKAKSEAQLTTAVTNGVGKMPAFDGKLSAETKSKLLSPMCVRLK